MQGEGGGMGRVGEAGSDERVAVREGGSRVAEGVSRDRQMRRGRPRNTAPNTAHGLPFLPRDDVPPRSRGRGSSGEVPAPDAAQSAARPRP